MFGQLHTFFSNRIETSEHHKDEQLQTHYFKSGQRDIITFLSDIIRKDSKLVLVDSLPDRGEITFKRLSPKQTFIVVTAVTVRPRCTAVDVIVTVDQSLPLKIGYTKQNVLFIYDELAQQFEYLGKSLAEKI